jgi:hypothetical protein
MISEPNISVNKLAEYIMSKGARQRQILKMRKYPDEDFSIGMYHREAAEAIAQYIASGAIDARPLELQHQILSQQTPEKIGTARRINSNIDALERFLSMLDDVDLMGAEPKLGSNSPPKLKIFNVNVSVRPEIMLFGNAPKGKKYVGAVKLHFSTTWPLNEDSAGYVSAIVQDFCKAHLADGEFIVNPSYCMVIDTASKRVYPGVKATTQRMKDVAAECQNIAALWPSI